MLSAALCLSRARDRGTQTRSLCFVVRGKCFQPPVDNMSTRKIVSVAIDQSPVAADYNDCRLVFAGMGSTWC